MQIWPRIFSLILPLALIGSGIAAFIYGGTRYLEEQRFLSHSESATARVIRNHIRGRSGKLEYCPDLEFTTKEGQSIAFSGSDLDCAYSAKYKAGQEVKVFYDPRDPKNAQVESFAAKSGDLLAGGVLCTLLVGIGLLVRLTLKRRWREDQRRTEELTPRPQI
jgi:hypothetical protein